MSSVWCFYFAAIFHTIEQYIYKYFSYRTSFFNHFLYPEKSCNNQKLYVTFRPSHIILALIKHQCDITKPARRAHIILGLALILLLAPCMQRYSLSRKSYEA